VVRLGLCLKIIQVLVLIVTCDVLGTSRACCLVVYGVFLLVLLSSDYRHLHGGVTYSVEVRNDNYEPSN
jgi:hypothetical protein